MNIHSYLQVFQLFNKRSIKNTTQTKDFKQLYLNKESTTAIKNKEAMKREGEGMGMNKAGE